MFSLYTIYIFSLKAICTYTKWKIYFSLKLFTVTITDPDLPPRNSIPIPSIDLNMSQYNEEMQKMHITINTETDEPPDNSPKM